MYDFDSEIMQYITTNFKYENKYYYFPLFSRYIAWEKQQVHNERRRCKIEEFKKLPFADSLFITYLKIYITIHNKKNIKIIIHINRIKLECTSHFVHALNIGI